MGIDTDEVSVMPGARWSLDDLKGGQSAIDALLAAQPGAASYIDVRTNALVVRTPGPLDAEARAAFARSGAVDVRFEVGAEIEQQHTRGGRSLLGEGTGCTTGFSTRTDSGVRGVITAAHCPPSVDWYVLNANASEQYDLNLYYEYHDANEDWQYMKQDGSNVHPVEPLYWNGSNYVTVTNGQPPSDSTMIGQTVCHYGRVTGASCGEVQTAWLDPGSKCGPGGDGNCSATWIAVVNNGDQPLECRGGDSGGPWYRAGRAYGIHSMGSVNNGVCELAVFMSLWYVENRPFVVLEG